MLLGHKLLNQGESSPPDTPPSNVQSFPLTDDEIAFVNALSMQTAALKSMAYEIISAAEKQMNVQIKIISDLKDKFTDELIAKHFGTSKPVKGKYGVDIINKTLAFVPDPEEAPAPDIDIPGF